MIFCFLSIFSDFLNRMIFSDFLVGFGFRKFGISDFRISDFRISEFRIFGFRISDFGFRISDSEIFSEFFSDFGFRISEFRIFFRIPHDGFFATFFYRRLKKVAETLSYIFFRKFSRKFSRIQISTR